MNNKKTNNLKPVFSSIVQNTKKQEDYISKMIKRDKLLGY